jgi:hypothetical protein
MRTVLLWCAVAALACAPGCKDEVIEPASIVFPTSNVSYARHVQPLFNQACAFSGCHGGGAGQQSSLLLTSYDNVMFTTMKVVERNLPDQSILVQRIEGKIAPRMPLYRPALETNQINGIRIWINEGALNN